MQRSLKHWTDSSMVPTWKEGSVWRNKRLIKKTIFFPRKTDRLPDLWVLVDHRSQRFVEIYADLLTIGLRNDDIQKFDSKWDRIILSVTKIPPDDISEGLYKLRIRVSEKLKTELELYDLEIHQKKTGPDYHRLKIMVKRSIEQDLRNKNFGARIGIYERNAVVKNQELEQRVENSWRVLAMGVKRAVFQRRQLQFPPRYQWVWKNDTVE